MRLKCSVDTSASVDGYIAKQDGSLNWLEKTEYSATQKRGLDCVAVTGAVDCLVMGRKIFEKVRTFDQWPYNRTSVIVLSHSLKQVPAELDGKVFFRSGTPVQTVNGIYAEG